jgi:GTP-binding protein
MSNTSKIRNVAVIAHVDHGKTTLMDKLMQEGGAIEKQSENKRVMDSNALEKERGITILSKCVTLDWNGYQFNMVDTPGHADFGGEVERILDMVDGVLLLACAKEGVMPQTQFVLTKALKKNLPSIVIINKKDRPDQRAEEVSDEVFELFMKLDATDEQLDFPVLYASAKNGWATHDIHADEGDMKIVFEKMIEHLPQPKGDPEAPLKMLVTMIGSDPFLGRILTGRIHQGTLKRNMPLQAVTPSGEVIEQGKANKIFIYKGDKNIFIDEASAGAIVSVSGLSEGTVSHTITDMSDSTPLEAPMIDPPTLTMNFYVNDSPFSGRDGDKLTARILEKRLFQEMEQNVSIKVEKSDGTGFKVAARGELQLGILIETMRREGFELSISPPKVIFQKDERGKRLEPVELVQMDLEETYLGKVVERANKRFANVHDITPLGHDRFRINMDCPTRCLIGFNSELLMQTRGTATMYRSFKGYEPYRGDLSTLRNGPLVSMAQGKALAHALASIEARGILFIGPGEEVYPGMIIGEHSRESELAVNPTKGKKLTNMRASGTDKEVKLAPPLQMTLEEALSYIKDGEKLEVTPKKVRLRKA